jgi:hypothetical protein
MAASSAACEASASVIVVDTASPTKVVEIAVGGQPNDGLHPDGRRAFVSNRLDDSVPVGRRQAQVTRRSPWVTNPMA